MFTLFLKAVMKAASAKMSSTSGLKTFAIGIKATMSIGSNQSKHTVDFSKWTHFF